MKKRYLYALLFGIPGLFLSAIFTLIVSGAVLGFLWLYVFGDNPWLSSTGLFVSILFVLVFLIVWTGIIILGYVTGKRLEKAPSLNKQHVLISAGLTLFFILFIAFQQWSVGNLGPKTDSAVCSKYCVSQGYSASGMPPRNSGDQTCSCYDDSGNEVLRTLLDIIELGTSK